MDCLYFSVTTWHCNLCQQLHIYYETIISTNRCDNVSNGNKFIIMTSFVLNMQLILALLAIIAIHSLAKNLHLCYVKYRIGNYLWCDSFHDVRRLRGTFAVPKLIVTANTCKFEWVNSTSLNASRHGNVIDQNTEFTGIVPNSQSFQPVSTKASRLDSQGAWLLVLCQISIVRVWVMVVHCSLPEVIEVVFLLHVCNLKTFFFKVGTQP